MQEQIKELRVKIDGLSQLVKELHPFEDVPNNSYLIAVTNTKGKTVYKMPMTSDELRKCADSLLLGKAWLGKLLGELGIASPYTKDGNRHSVADIEPTADVEADALENCSKDYNLLNHIEKVDWLRQELKGVVMIIDALTLSASESEQKAFTRNMSIARTNSYNHICEALFWLGFELQRIKENN